MTRNYLALMAGALMLAVSASALPASACDGENWNRGKNWSNGQKHARKAYRKRIRNQRRLANNWQNQVYGQPINYRYYNNLNNINNPYYTPVSNGVLSNLLNYF